MPTLPVPGGFCEPGTNHRGVTLMGHSARRRADLKRMKAKVRRIGNIPAPVMSCGCYWCCRAQNVIYKDRDNGGLTLQEQRART